MWSHGGRGRRIKLELWHTRLVREAREELREDKRRLVDK
jgi:hypothetical protein